MKGFDLIMSKYTGSILTLNTQSAVGVYRPTSVYTVFFIITSWADFDEDGFSHKELNGQLINNL